MRGRTFARRKHHLSSCGRGIGKEPLASRSATCSNRGRFWSRPAPPFHFWKPGNGKPTTLCACCWACLRDCFPIFWSRPTEFRPRRSTWPWESPPIYCAAGRTSAALPLLETGKREANNALCVLPGMPPRLLPDLLEPADRIPPPPQPVAVGIPADLLRRRPDVRRAERHAAAQSARIGIAKSDF